MSIVPTANLYTYIQLYFSVCCGTRLLVFTDRYLFVQLYYTWRFSLVFFLTVLFLREVKANIEKTIRSRSISL